MLADQYDAIRTVRPYKPPVDAATTRAILVAGDGRTQPQHFDPRLLDAFKSLEAEFARIHDELMTL